MDGTDAIWALGFLGLLAILFGIQALVFGIVLFGLLLLVATGPLAVWLFRRYRGRAKAIDVRMEFFLVVGVVSFTIALFLPSFWTNEFFAQLAGCQLNQGWTPTACLTGDWVVQFDLAVLLIGTVGCATLALWAGQGYRRLRYLRLRSDLA